MEHPERDRHLSEDVAGVPLADHARDPVDVPEHLQPALEDAEERPFVPLVHGELAGTSLMSATTRESWLRSAGSRSAKTATRAISSAVTMRRGL